MLVTNTFTKVDNISWSFPDTFRTRTPFLNQLPNSTSWRRRNILQYNWNHLLADPDQELCHFDSRLNFTEPRNRPVTTVIPRHHSSFHHAVWVHLPLFPVQLLEGVILVIEVSLQSKIKDSYRVSGSQVGNQQKNQSKYHKAIGIFHRLMLCWFEETFFNWKASSMRCYFISLALMSILMVHNLPIIPPAKLQVIANKLVEELENCY